MAEALAEALRHWLRRPLVICDEDAAAALHGCCRDVQLRLEEHFPALGGGPLKLTAAAEDGVPHEYQPSAKKAKRAAGDGELVLLGAGIKAMAHLTREAMVHLRAADVVFGALNPTGPDRRWLELAIGKQVVDLNQFYPAAPGADRRAAYVQGAEAVMRELRRGRRVAVAKVPSPR